MIKHRKLKSMKTGQKPFLVTTASNQIQYKQHQPLSGKLFNNIFFRQVPQLFVCICQLQDCLVG